MENLLIGDTRKLFRSFPPNERSITAVVIGCGELSRQKNIFHWLFVTSHVAVVMKPMRP